MPQLTLSFADPVPPAPAPAPLAPAPAPAVVALAPLPDAPPRPDYAPRPADLDDADLAGWAVLKAGVAWSALGLSRRLGVYADELALAVVYVERRLVAAGQTADAARALTGRRLMVPALEGADPWPLAAVLLTGAAPPLATGAGG